MKAKRCKLCGGEPKYVHYAPPRTDHPELWKDMENGLEPIMLFKRLECKLCGATVPSLSLSLDDAVKIWNEQNILVRYMEENVLDVEESTEIKTEGR